MKYEIDHDIQWLAEDIIKKIGLDHIDIERIICVKSSGSKSKQTVARIHGLSKIMQKALRIKAIYAIEFIAENFDHLEKEEKIKTIIHELLHIPKNMGGGFRNHRPYVTRRHVNKIYKAYKESKDYSTNIPGLSGSATEALG